MHHTGTSKHIETIGNNYKPVMLVKCTMRSIIISIAKHIKSLGL